MRKRDRVVCTVIQEVQTGHPGGPAGQQQIPGVNPTTQSHNAVTGRRRVTRYFVIDPCLFLLVQPDLTMAGYAVSLSYFYLFRFISFVSLDSFRFRSFRFLF